MHRIIVVFVLVCVPISAWAQAVVEPSSSAPSPPRADESLLPDQASQSPAPDDQLNRLQRRIDELESRIDRSNSEPAAVQQEAIPTPATESSAVATDNAWRYRNHNGAWWYWLPSNRWVQWSNGAWVDAPEGSSVPTTYTSPTYTLPAVRYVAPTYTYYRPSYSYGSSYYPSYGYGGYGGYGGGYGGYYGGRGIGIGLSFGGGHHHHGGHYHGGHGHSGHHHGGHHHGGHGHGGHGHGGHGHH